MIRKALSVPLLLLRYVAGLTLLVVLLPLVYLLVLMLVVFLPPVCVWAIMDSARSAPGPATFRKLIPDLFVALVVLPFALLAFAAPLRSLLVAAGSLFTPVSTLLLEIHGLIYDPLVPVFGPLFPYWLDFYWGVYGVAVIVPGGLVRQHSPQHAGPADRGLADRESPLRCHRPGRAGRNSRTHRRSV